MVVNLLWVFAIYETALARDSPVIYKSWQVPLAFADNNDNAEERYDYNEKRENYIAHSLNDYGSPICMNSDIILKILNTLMTVIKPDLQKVDEVNEILDLLTESLKYTSNENHDMLQRKTNEIKNIVIEEDMAPYSSKLPLRQLSDNDFEPKENIKTKIIFKYELPGLSQPGCREAFDKLILAHNSYRDLVKYPMCHQNNLNVPENEQNNFGDVSNLEIIASDKDLHNNLKPKYEVPSNILGPDNLNSDLYQNILPQYVEKLKPSFDIQTVEQLPKYAPSQFKIPINYPSNQVPHYNKPSQKNPSDILDMLIQSHKVGVVKNPVVNYLQFLPDKQNPKINYQQKPYIYKEKIIMPPVPLQPIPEIFANYIKKNYPNIKYPGSPYDVPNENHYNIVNEAIYPNNIVNEAIYPNGILDNRPKNNNDIYLYPNILNNINKYKNGLTNNYIDEEIKDYDVQNSYNYAKPPYFSSDILEQTIKSYLNEPNYEGNTEQIPYEHDQSIISKIINLLSSNIINTPQAIKLLAYYEVPHNSIKYIIKHISLWQNHKGSNAQLNYGNLVNPEISLDDFVGGTNFDKFNSLPQKHGVVELTYLLKHNKPFVYQPIYFVKYRLPVMTFTSNIKKLLLQKPDLKKNPIKLYQELIAMSNVTELIPQIQGYDKDDILNLTFNKGSLIKASVIHDNRTHENVMKEEQLKVVQDLTSDIKPNEVLKVVKEKLGGYTNEITDTVLNHNFLVDSDNSKSNNLDNNEESDLRVIPASTLKSASYPTVNEMNLINPKLFANNLASRITERGIMKPSVAHMLYPIKDNTNKILSKNIYSTNIRKPTYLTFMGTAE